MAKTPKSGPYARLRPGTKVGDEAKIGNFVETKKADIGRGAKVSHLSYIGDAELGMDVNIGAGTITCNYDGYNKHLTKIGDGAFIGSNSSLIAPVTIGKGAYLGSSSAVSKDVPDDALVVTRAPEREIKGWGKKFRAKNEKKDKLIMCGIIGVIGKNDVTQSIFDGLKRLEYRGYDSAGIATIADGQLMRRRAEGKLDALREELSERPLQGSIGIGHTRWATHGPAIKANAHPHRGERVAVVHNGIIENYKELKEQLIADGVSFSSDTDTEVIAHLFSKNLNGSGDVRQAAAKTFAGA